MSVKVMGLVWETDLPANMKLVLMAYADKAGHDGKSVYPSVGLVAFMTGYKERNVQYITRLLESEGYLVSDGTSHLETNKWSIQLDKLGGAKFAPGGVQDATEGGAEIAPDPSVKQPSVKHSSSVKPPQNLTDGELQKVYVKVTGTLTFPSKSMEQDITRLRIIAEKYGQDTIEYLSPYFQEWQRRGYSKANTSWLDWATAGEIPKQRAKPPMNTFPKKGKGSSKEEREVVYAEWIKQHEEA